MLKWFFKWLIRLTLLVVVLVVILLLSRNAILRVYMEHEIHARTGMDAEIGRFSLGLAEPEITIQDLRLYNPPDFAGTPFLKIRELHVEYDPVALAQHELRIKLLRLNLGELDIVKNQNGQTNIFSLGLAVPSKKSGGSNSNQVFTKQTGLEFKGIDVLNVSIGQVKFIDLENQQRNRTQNIGIEDLVIKNVKSQADLAGLAVLVALRGGGFFDSVIGLPDHGTH
ncbi:MAG TPA: hypothetical protein VL970_01485 [Candidatus Acidoferrales bacterium]|nr:hypothetical protein [Candidatus Acidoferrales bacterium]